jgi:pimeloyl-ACP methyl ester carboxylesterase
LPTLHETSIEDYRMEIVVVAAIVAVSFGAAATWLLATRLPERWLEKSASNGRFAHLAAQETEVGDAKPPRMQAHPDARHVRRARVRARLNAAAGMMRALRPAAARRSRGHTARP